MEIRKPKLPRNGSYRCYDTENLQKAYIAVQTKSMSARKASRTFGVPKTTLLDRLRGRVDIDVVKSGPAPLFSLEQESLLNSHIVTMAEVGYGYSIQETINLATDYAVNLGLRDMKHPLTDRWFYNFLGRWPDIKVKKPRSLEVARAKSATRLAVDNYFAELKLILTKYDLMDKPHLVYNVDEKGLNTEHTPPKIVAGRNNKTQAVTSGKSKTVTMIGCVNGIGSQVPPYFIFPGARMLDALLDGASPGVDGTVSPTGWSNTDIFNNYMRNHLSKYLPHRQPDTYALVLYDGHKSHVSLQLIEWAKSQRIILFVLPPHCSHLLQPLDVSCFGPFQLAWNAACHKHLRETGGCVVTRYDVCRIACNVHSTTLTPKNIQSAYRKCGLYPFNANAVDDCQVAPATTFRVDDPPSVPPPDVPAPPPDVPAPPPDVPAPPPDVPAPPPDVPAPPPDVPAPPPDVPAPPPDVPPHDPENFLLQKGGKVLANVQRAKKRRNTLSKIVGGKAITEESVMCKIQEHQKQQIKPSKHQKQQIKPSKKQTSKPNPTVFNSQTPGPSGVKKARKSTYVPQQAFSSSESEDEVTDDEKCIICKKFSPDSSKRPHIIIVNWGQCEKCKGWVHLGFCTPVRVIRRGDSFVCNGCAGPNEE